MLFPSACSDAPAAPSSSSSGSSSGQSSVSASFKDDVVPILATSCALAACHAAKESNLGIHLTYDKAQIYAELQKNSPTYNGAKFVVPGKPEESLLVGKMDGTQGKIPGCNGGCGSEMPPGEILSKKDRDVVRAWIKNGAKDD
jgi:hypothetical protein